MIPKVICLSSGTCRFSPKAIELAKPRGWRLSMDVPWAYSSSDTRAGRASIPSTPVIPATALTVTEKTSTTASAKVFIGRVEITQPDLFNNGMVVIHGLQGFIAPFSCDVGRMTSLSFPFHPDHRSGQHNISRLPARCSLLSCA